MGLVGLRFAHMKRKLGVRTAIAAVLEEGPVICSGGGRSRLDDHDRDSLYNDWPQWDALAADQRCAAQQKWSSTRLKAGCCRLLTLTQWT
jgi:hypothetical protein